MNQFTSAKISKRMGFIGEKSKPCYEGEQQQQPGGQLTYQHQCITNGLVNRDVRSLLERCCSLV